MTKLSAIGLVLLLGLPACSPETRQETEDTMEGAAHDVRQGTEDMGHRVEDGFKGAREGYERGASE